MPSQLSPFTTSEFQIRFKEPTFTANINKKLFANEAPGLYRGFKLSTNGAALTVTVTADADSGDHVAVYATQTGFSLAVRRVGNFNLDVSAYAAQTIFICIFGFYSSGLTTFTEVRAYTEAEITAIPAELPELLFLGKIVVPAAGVIPAANITPTRRTSAWANVAKEVTLWQPLLRNSGFEASRDDGSEEFAARYWQMDPAAPFPNFVMKSTAPIHSGNRAARSTGVLHDGEIFQIVNAPCSPGDMLKYRIFLSTSAVRISGNVQIFFEFTDADGAVLIEESIGMATNADAGAFREFTDVFAVPTGAAFLKRVGVETNNLTFGASATVTIDDFQCWLERKGPLDKLHNDERWQAQYSATSIILDDREGTLDDIGASILFDMNEVTEGIVKFGRKDTQTGSVDPPAVSLPGRTFLGDGIMGTETQTATMARINRKYSKTAGHNYTYVSEDRPSTTGTVLRQYVQATGPVKVFTINAKWRASGSDDWTKDVNGEKAFRVDMMGSLIVVYEKKFDEDTPWGDGGGPTGWTYSSSYGAQSAAVNGTLILGETDPIEGVMRQIVSPSQTLDRTFWLTSNEEHGVGDKHFRMYMNNAGGIVVGSIEYTFNAWWNDASSEWEADDPGNTSGTRATKIILGRGEVRILMRSNTTNPWDDTISATGWDEAKGLQFNILTNFMTIFDARMQWAEPTLSGTNSDDTTDVNVMQANTFLKAAARVSWDDNAVVDPTVESKLNISSIVAEFAVGAHQGEHKVTLAHPMSDGDFWVVLTNMDQANGTSDQIQYGTVAAGVTTQIFYIRAYDTSTNAFTSMTGAGGKTGKYCFLVFGTQTP